MTTASFTNLLKKYVILPTRLGIVDFVRLVLRELGIPTLQSIVYPELERRFVVQFDPVWRWIEKGIKDPNVVKFAEARIGNGSVVFDIGAHVGEWALLFSELAGSSGRVVAFEPDPVARAALEKNLEMNRITNVSVEEQCVSDKTGRVLLGAERFGSGLSSIVRPSRLGRRYNEIEVESITLDDYCEAHGILPDWIKIDAEGAETLIIRGMQRLIETRHPPVILEFHSDALTHGEAASAWSSVTARASNVGFLQSRVRNHAYLEELSRDYVPDCGFLIVYIKY